MTEILIVIIRAGQTGALIQPLLNNFTIPKNCMFLFVELKDFWWENDVIGHTSKIQLDIFTKLMHDF